jgi:uncharacterized HhH-GPD family protein
VTNKGALLPFTGDPDADQLVSHDPLALLIGFELDQQVTLQKAFSGPHELRRRIGTLEAARIAAMDPARLEAAFKQRPALHRFPANMARRVQELCSTIERDYGGDAGRVWGEVHDAQEAYRRLLALPGIGDMKARTIVAILVKRLGVQLSGWQEIAPQHMSLGDVDSAEKLAEYQAGKRARKAEMRAAGRRAQR